MTTEHSYSWLEDPQVFSINRINAHSDHKYFANEKEAKNYFDSIGIDIVENAKNVKSLNITSDEDNANFYSDLMSKVHGQFAFKHKQVNAEEFDPRTYVSSFVQSLNGSWKFKYAPNLDSIPSEFFKKDFNTDNFDDILVPGHIQTQGYDKIHYTNTAYPWDGVEYLRPPQVAHDNPVANYVKEFKLNDNLKNCRKTILSFQGAESAIYVWLNGHFVGYSEDSFTPADFDITPYLKQDNNKLAVQVFKRCSGSWLEDQDFWRFSGIFREVLLFGIPEVHVGDLKLTNKYDYNNGIAEFGANLKLDYLQDCNKDAIVYIKLEDMDNNIVWSNKFLAENYLEFSASIDNAHPWSAEDPYLYTLKIEVLKHKSKNLNNLSELENMEEEDFHNDFKTIEFVQSMVGFRTFEMKDKIMHLNGRRIVFNGVNRHEFNPSRGRAITKHDMDWDIWCIKTNNMNCVRTSHYPNQTYFYELCDKFGLYMIDETNLESHGSWQKLGQPEPSWNVPGNLEEWRDNVLDRANSMYQRDKNHTSILIWSCGNESYAGTNICDMADFFREVDSSRLVHYEGCVWNRDYERCTDMESRMYAKPAEIEQYLQSSPKKPYISCEYVHSMGNSLGNLSLYTELEAKYPMYQGGFIWDFIDQFVYKQLDDKTCVLAYGGDFDDRPSDYEFSGDGIVFANRQLTPKIQEVNQLFSNVELKINSNTVVVKNKNLFIDTKKYKFISFVTADGKVIWSKSLNLDVKPLSTGSFNSFDNFNLEEFERSGKLSKNDEIIFNTICYYIDDNFGFGGYSFTQSVVKPWVAIENKITLEKSTQPLQIIKGDVNIGAYGKDFRVMFSLSEGTISSLVYNNKEYIIRKPKTSFWRACTDNDRGAGYDFERSFWLTAGKFQKACDYKMDVVDGNLEVEIIYCFHINVQENKNDKNFSSSSQALAYSKQQYVNSIKYVIYPTGLIDVTIKYPGYENLPNIPIFAYDLATKPEFKNVEIYGRGPEENYWDRKIGAAIQTYKTTAQKCLTPYALPQECGNRCDVRYLKLTNDERKGLCFSAKNNDSFEASVLPNSEYELENALHSFELPENRYTHVRIAAKQMGVGGDDSWGAPVHSRYQIPSTTKLEKTFNISPIN